MHIRSTHPLALALAASGLLTACGGSDSPAMTTTPPCFEVPAALAWRSTSPLRSTPGPLPYQMLKTPS